MRLFDDRERTDLGPAIYGEPHYRYLERSARPAFDVVRGLMERWLSKYPQYHRRALTRRLSLQDDVHFEAAFFELYCYELCNRLVEAIRVHPRLHNSSTRPDFELTVGSRRRLLLEAVTVDEVSKEARAARTRLQDVYNALNKVSSPDYFLKVEDTGELRTPIPGKRLRRQVQSFLDQLDYEEVRRLAAKHDLSAFPETVFTYDGCTIVVSVIPVSPEHRGDLEHRPVGMIGPGEAYRVDHHTPLREAVRKKARHYGRLRRPFVVAVNAVGMHLEKMDILQALFGTEQYVVHWDPDPSKREPQPSRKLDGVFMGPRGPRNTRVSAVLVVSSLLPWTVAAQQPALYHNPWTRYPIIGALGKISEHRLVDDQLVETPGRPVAELLGLPERWPFE